jgi:hypothetical protein
VEIRGDMGNQMLMFSSLRVQVNQTAVAPQQTLLHVSFTLLLSSYILLPCILTLNEFKTMVGITPSGARQPDRNQYKQLHKRLSESRSAASFMQIITHKHTAKMTLGLRAKTPLISVRSSKRPKTP